MKARPFDNVQQTSPFNRNDVAYWISFLHNKCSLFYAKKFYITYFILKAFSKLNNSKFLNIFSSALKKGLAYKTVKY